MSTGCQKTLCQQYYMNMSVCRYVRMQLFQNESCSKCHQEKFVKECDRVWESERKSEREWVNERVRVRKPLRTAKELLQTEKFTFFHSRSSQILLRKSGCHQTLLPPTVERWRILIYAVTRPTHTTKRMCSMFRQRATLTDHRATYPVNRDIRSLLCISSSTGEMVIPMEAR